MRRALLVGGLAAGLALGAITPAGAGGSGAPLTVINVVEGAVPAGTTFTVTIDCDLPSIVTDGGPVSSVELTFDAEGNPIGDDTVTFVETDECMVTETDTGGAETVSYQCFGEIPIDDDAQGSGGRFGPRRLGVIDDPCSASGPQPDPIEVLIIDAEQFAEVTITNTFPTPPPTTVPATAAPAVGAVPRFTG